MFIKTDWLSRTTSKQIFPGNVDNVTLIYLPEVHYATLDKTMHYFDPSALIDSGWLVMNCIVMFDGKCFRFFFSSISLTLFSLTFFFFPLFLHLFFSFWGRRGISGSRSFCFVGVWAATWARKGKVRDNPKFLNPKGDAGTRQKHSKSVFLHFVTNSLQIAGFSADFHFASNIE